ncbi:hypothetical protein Dip510_000360 [Elusimicrobium posterum]|uniref:hypothetical protein n=1 Tax=Elusimicrobium posterum TaxID=3116653 RepID=UPI003C7893CF
MKKSLSVLITAVLISNTLFPGAVFAQDYFIDLPPGTKIYDGPNSPTPVSKAKASAVVSNFNQAVAEFTSDVKYFVYEENFPGVDGMNKESIKNLKATGQIKEIEWSLERLKKHVKIMDNTYGAWQEAASSAKGNGYDRYIRDYIVREGGKGTLRLELRTLMGPEAMAIIADNGGLVMYNEFTSRLSAMYQNPGDPYHVAEIKDLLKQKNFDFLTKKLFPGASAAEAEQLTRLTRAYLDYAHKRSFLEMEIKDFADHNPKAKITKSNFLKQKGMTEALEKYEKAKADFKNMSKTDANQKLVEKAISNEFRIADRAGSEYSGYRTKKTATSRLLKSLKGGSNLIVLVGLVGGGLILEGIFENIHDAENKATLNNLTAMTIKDKSARVKAVKENSYILPVISEKQRNEILDRKDVLSDGEKLRVAINYLSFYNDVNNNPDKYRKIIKDMEAQDNQLAYFESQDSASQQKTLAFENAKKNVKAPQEVLNFNHSI